MQRYLVYVFFFLAVIVKDCYSDCGCNTFYSYDWVNISGPTAYEDEGFVQFGVTLYTTCADGGDDKYPDFYIYDNCGNLVSYGHHYTYYKQGCMTLCYPCWCGEPCDEVASHFYNTYVIHIYYHGKFKIEIHWDGNVY